jgi:hypothetical protein
MLLVHAENTALEDRLAHLDKKSANEPCVEDADDKGDISKMAEVKLDLFLPAFPAPKRGERETLGLSCDRDGNQFGQRIGFMRSPWAWGLGGIGSSSHAGMRWNLRQPAGNADGRDFPLHQNEVGQKVFKKGQNVVTRMREIENGFGPARAQRPGVEWVV